MPADSDGGQLVAGGVVVHRAHWDLQIFGDLGGRHHVVLFRTHAATSACSEPGLVLMTITQKPSNVLAVQADFPAKRAGIGAIRALLEANANIMTERPDPFAALDYFAAATIAHEYVADLHRELDALGADSAHTRALLGESAAVVTERMPALTRELRQLGAEWETQNLLDPPRAERTLQRAETRLVEAEPELSALRARQDEIVVEMRRFLERARGS